MESIDLSFEILNLQLEGDDDKQHSLNDFKGRKIVLYFYPKDNTPGCTTEACDFSRLNKMYSDAGYKIIGVSKDSITEHKSFKEKQDINFLLLSDPDLLLHKAFKSWGIKKVWGASVTGVIRSTFLLNESLEIISAYRNVRAKGHAERILKEL